MGLIDMVINLREENKALKAENARLREGLRQYIQYYHKFYSDEVKTRKVVFEDMFAIATTTLNEREE